MADIGAKLSILPEDNVERAAMSSFYNLRKFASIKANGLEFNGSKKLLFVAFLSLFCALIFTNVAHAVPVVGVNQRVLVVPVKFSGSTSATVCGATSTPRLSGTEIVSMLQGQVGPWIEQNSYGQTTFDFELATTDTPDGWFSFPPGFFVWGARVDVARNRIIPMIDGGVDFAERPPYKRLLVINNCTGFGGNGMQNLGNTYMTDEGAVEMTYAHENIWTRAGFGPKPYDPMGAVAAHEFGHSFNLPDVYSDQPFQWNGGLRSHPAEPWGIMTLSPKMVHFLGAQKLKAGWLNNDDGVERTVTIGPVAFGEDIEETHTLEPLQDTGPNKVLKIPFVSGREFTGYVVENRQLIRFDQELPQPGVLVTRVPSTTLTFVPTATRPNAFPTDTRPLMVMEDPDTTRPAEYALEIGDTFIAPETSLTISVVGPATTGAFGSLLVHVKYAEPGKSDPYINKGGDDNLDSPDIWIDSEENGFTWDQVNDRPWIGRTNRIFYRVHNDTSRGDYIGVDVFTAPLRFGRPDWTLEGHREHRIYGNEEGEYYVEWTPTDQPTLIRVEIESTRGEITAANNWAEEAVVDFFTTANSPYRPVNFKAAADNPSETTSTPVQFIASNVPQGWDWEISPDQTILPPGGSGEVDVTFFPSDTIPGVAGNAYKIGYIGEPKIQAYVEGQSSWVPIGGVEARIHLVRSSELTLQPDPLSDEGGAVRLQGSLKPTSGDATIAVELTKDGNRAVVFASVNTKGNYYASFRPWESGLWNAQAFFGGNRTLESTESNSIQFEAEAVPPAQVGFQTSTDIIGLYWQPYADSFDVTGYKVFSAGTSPTLVGSTEDTSYSLVGLTPGKTYSYFMKAYGDGAIETTSSNVVTITLGSEGETLAGSEVSSVTISPDEKVYLAFGDVTKDGITTVLKNTKPTYPLPSGVGLIGEELDIATTAGFVGPITVAIRYNEDDVPGNEADLKLYHYETNRWVDRTLYVDTVNNILVGQVESFSLVAAVSSVAPATGTNANTLLALALTLMASGGAVVYRRRRWQAQ